MDRSLRPGTIRINDVALAYIGHGSGDPVVFVHGSLGDYRTWGQQMEPFSDHARTIAYSRRYHWPKARPSADTRHRIADHARDLGALIESLEMAPAHVIGTSRRGDASWCGGGRRQVVHGWGLGAGRLQSDPREGENRAP